MDTLSHGIWGWVVLRGKGSRLARWGLLAGAAPDLLYFFPSAIERVVKGGWSALSVSSEPGIWRAGGPPMPEALVEAYHRYYVWTHSLVMLGLVVGVLALMGVRRWLWLSVPYALHIGMDLPTHERYLTRPFYPISNWTIHGIAWSDPRIFWPHLVLLVTAVVWTYRRARRAK